MAFFQERESRDKLGLGTSRWVDGLVGRTATDDDGRVFELIAQARERWT